VSSAIPSAIIGVGEPDGNENGPNAVLRSVDCIRTIGLDLFAVLDLSW
jgi:hypothetical protein